MVSENLPNDTNYAKQKEIAEIVIVCLTKKLLFHNDLKNLIVNSKTIQNYQYD